MHGQLLSVRRLHFKLLPNIARIKGQLIKGENLALGASLFI